MKHFGKIVLLASVFVLTACPSDGEAYISDLEKVQNNHMDLPNPTTRYFNGIRYRLSNIFYPHYNSDYVISDLYEVSMSSELNMYFSIESFTRDEASEFQFQFEDDDEITAMDAVHDHYAIKRNSTLEEATVSVKKKVPKSVGFPGVIQVINGSTYRGTIPNSYFFATLEFEDQIVVVQLIGSQEVMGHMYDDFIDILSSISI